MAGENRCIGCALGSKSVAGPQSRNLDPSNVRLLRKLHHGVARLHGVVGVDLNFVAVLRVRGRNKRNNPENTE